MVDFGRGKETAITFMAHEYPKRVRRIVGRELRRQRRINTDFSRCDQRVQELFAEQSVLSRLSRRAEISIAKKSGMWPFMRSPIEGLIELQRGLGL